MGSILRVSEHGGVERIETGPKAPWRGTMTACLYRIGSTLVDAGVPNQADALLAHLDRPEVPAITHVLLTHSHEDHVGLAAELAGRGAVVLAPEASLEPLSNRGALPGYRARTWGRSRPVDATAYEGAKVSTPDATFEIVPTPGHSPDHVALFEIDRGHVFAGDAYLGRRAELRFDEDLDASLGSLQAMAELDAKALFPGHGPVIERPSEACRRAVDHYRGLRERAWRLRRHEALTLPALTRRLLGVEGFLRHYTRGEFSKRNLVVQLLGSPPEGVTGTA